MRASADYADSFLVEDSLTESARERAVEAGLQPVSQGVGALLAFLAATTAARSAVEIGTGTGVSAGWLLRGMAPDGVLTSIDAEAEHQRQARAVLTQGGVAANRVRLINGDALDVMGRLADGSYDLVLVDVPSTSYGDLLAAALRLLRVGGVLVVHDALAGGRIADSSVRDTHTTALRELAKLLRGDPRLLPVAVPIGAGVLAAVRRPDPEEER